MFARAAITTTTVAGLTVPAKVQPQPDGSAMYSCRVRTSQNQAVEVGKFSMVEEWKLRGLQPSDRVVVAGAGYLKDGDRVQSYSSHS